MKTSHRTLLAGLVAGLLPLAAGAQVNSGSDGHDGALNPASNLVIDMADHPDGIYQYTSVNIPAGVTVSFIPNAGNKPVVWLVQNDCTVGGVVSVNGKTTFEVGGSVGGPGGFRGGPGDRGVGAPAGKGIGPGGGNPQVAGNQLAGDGGNGSFGTLGDQWTVAITGGSRGQAQPGEVYGGPFLVPLIGGSGGGGGGTGGGGGGGAILIAANGSVAVSGSITANGADGSNGNSYPLPGSAGGGSGGAIRIVATNMRGAGSLWTAGGIGLGGYSGGYAFNNGGQGRIRLDTFSDEFSGPTKGAVTRGYQPIILPTGNQNIQLAIQSIGGVAVAANPSGVLANPDVIVPAQQTNPVSVVVKCTNVPLNSEITVVVQPANGAAVQAVGLNHAGTAAASTATVSLNLPRGGGIIYAKAVTGIAGTASTGSGDPARSLAETGWTATGERFKAIEVTAPLGRPQRIAYITESGQRYEAQ